MSITRTRTAITTTALLAAVLAGTAACGGGTDTDPAPTSSEPPKITDIEHAGRSPEQQATEGAIAAVKGMYKARATIENDPRADMNQIAQFTTEPYLGRLSADMELRRSQGIVGEGEIRVVRTNPEEVTAPKDEKGNPIAGDAEVLLKTCADVTEYHSYGPDKKDLVDPDRLPQQQSIYRVVNQEWPSGSGWRIVENTLPTVEECDAY